MKTTYIVLIIMCLIFLYKVFKSFKPVEIKRRTVNDSKINTTPTYNEKLMDRLAELELKKLPHLSRNEAKSLAKERIERDNK